MRGISRPFSGWTSFLEQLHHLLPKFLRVFMLVDGDSVLHRCFEQFLIAVGADCDRTVLFAGEFAAVNILPGHHGLLHAPDGAFGRRQKISRREKI